MQEKQNINEEARNALKHAKHVYSPIGYPPTHGNKVYFLTGKDYIMLFGAGIDMTLRTDERKVYVYSSDKPAQSFDMDKKTLYKSMKFLKRVPRLERRDDIRCFINTFAPEIFVTGSVVISILLLRLACHGPKHQCIQQPSTPTQSVTDTLSKIENQNIVTYEQLVQKRK